MSFLDSIDNRETECSKSQVAYSPMTIVSSFSSYMLSEMGQDLNSRPPSPPNELLSLLDKPDTPLVLPVITPRFVPTCTAEIMQFLGYNSSTLSSNSKFLFKLSQLFFFFFFKNLRKLVCKIRASRSISHV